MFPVLWDEEREGKEKMRDYKKPVFTARQYDTLAEFIKKYEKDYQKVPMSLITLLCVLFKRDNPAFKIEKFMKHSGR